MWRNLASNPPDEWIIARESCHEKNPFYEQYVWNDETAHQFIEAHFTWFLPTYTTYLLPPQRVDALRYLLLWHFGGIYLDPEIGCQLSIEPLLHDVTALLPQNWPYGVSQRMIASRANHPFVIKVALDITDHGHSWPKHATAMFSTGPIIISRVLARWFRAMRESPDITILPLEIFVGEKGAFFMSHEPQIPPGDEFSIFQFVLENPIGWGGAALALGVMSTVIFGVSMRSKSIRDQTSTSLIV
ncbi:mannosyl phosphorylinositol ceramide synthase SUR1 [Penicillium atrosanguineum]|nr:mannosyl phosphorylinositol ceramide synthase SUR1 [Penicillium atrosanguineum]KAJ5148026.1 mannosyl phosphorylinositol ceramide synthase SUR1 [Penicillium atrosanguineum]